MPDISLVNLNLLFMRYGEEIERENHVPLGCLYLTSALEAAGYCVDLRDYQMVEGDPFDMNVFLSFLEDPAPIIGLSCMANLLPFTILAIRAIKERWPDRTVVLGGVGSKDVEELILGRFSWVDIICRGEGELTVVDLLRTLQGGGDLGDVRGISWRGADGQPRHNPDRPRIADLDKVPWPAFGKIDLKRYAGYGLMTSRGCPYPCTFCSVAPVWGWQTRHRSAANIVEEMKLLHESAGVDLFLFQDEFFVSGKKPVMDFCDALRSANMKVEWKAFGRVNLTDREMMQAMADTGCLEIRFGIESGSDRILKLIKKGFTTAEVLEVVPAAVEIFPRVDTFYVWGYPFETMEDFSESVFQMVSFRSMGARILPSLLSLLPQTEIYRDCKNQAGGMNLEFCPWLLPEFVFTGHEICRAGEVEIPEKYRAYFDIILNNKDIFSGFFHLDLETNVLPKLEMLREFGFYPKGRQGGSASASRVGASHAGTARPETRTHVADSNTDICPLECKR